MHCKLSSYTYQIAANGSITGPHLFVGSNAHAYVMLKQSTNGDCDCELLMATSPSGANSKSLSGPLVGTAANGAVAYGNHATPDQAAASANYAWIAPKISSVAGCTVTVSVLLREDHDPPIKSADWEVGS
jgi:hypothetical protein